MAKQSVNKINDTTKKMSSSFFNKLIQSKNEFHKIVTETKDINQREKKLNGEHFKVIKRAVLSNKSSVLAKVGTE